ncbi:MAG: UbiD family decarboxylase domain-containing protein, partial [Solirubrobacteraceae bacterium]
MPDADQSLRSALAVLERDGELVRVTEPVSPRYELSALLASVDDGPALLFEQVEGSRMPVVGGVMGSRPRIAAGLGVPVGELQKRIVDALGAPLAPREVTDAPCQEIQVTSPDLGELPIPWFFEHETGPYVTAGAIVARDLDTGAANLSIARLK